MIIYSDALDLLNQFKARKSGIGSSSESGTLHENLLGPSDTSDDEYIESGKSKPKNSGSPNKKKQKLQPLSRELTIDDINKP